MSNFSYFAGPSRFGWLGGVFFSRDGWTGAALMTVALALIAAALAAIVLTRPAAISR